MTMTATSATMKTASTTTTTMTATSTTMKTATTTTTPPIAGPILLMACLWALVNAVGFAVADIATLITNRTPCTKSTWLIRCAALTDAAAAEVRLLLDAELCCIAAAALAASLHMLLATRRTTTTPSTTSRAHSRCGAAVVDALAWVALAATAAMHCMEVASDRIFLAAKAGDKYIFVDVVFTSVLLAVDLLAAVLLCCFPRRRLELAGEQQGGDIGNKV